MWITPQVALLTDLLEEPTELTGPALTEMVELALQDLEPVDCGTKLLEVLLGDEMTRGMRDAVVRDLLEGEPWVEHSHMNWHRAIYEAAWMAHASHGGIFTRPRGASIVLGVEALDDDALACLDAPATPALTVRLAAPLMTRSVLPRLFEDELAGTSFPDAANIAWFAEWSAREGRTAKLTIEGTLNWWGYLAPGAPLDIQAWPDVEVEDED